MRASEAELETLKSEIEAMEAVHKMEEQRYRKVLRRVERAHEAAEKEKRAIDSVLREKN